MPQPRAFYLTRKDKHEIKNDTTDMGGYDLILAIMLVLSYMGGEMNDLKKKLKALRHEIERPREMRWDEQKYKKDCIKAFELVMAEVDYLEAKFKENNNAK